ncbi:Uncharacterized protein PRO82_000262 [Candidatus Protochlamydia amoebophila]|nr:Uncharacterized protein [Candidatus Protochlamydia amoebophila]
MHEIIKELPESLNVTVTNAEKIQVAVIELDGQWSYGENEDNQNNDYGLFCTLLRGKL